MINDRGSAKGEKVLGGNRNQCLQSSGPHRRLIACSAQRIPRGCMFIGVVGGYGRNGAWVASVKRLGSVGRKRGTREVVFRLSDGDNASPKSQLKSGLQSQIS